MTVAALLRSVVAALDAAGVPFMLTGSLAAAYHGAGRATMDIDVVIDPTEPQLGVLVRALERSGLYVSGDAADEALTHRSMFNVVDTASGWKADLIIRKLRPFSEMELRRRQPAAYEGCALWVASAEDVIVAKLEWARQGGGADQQLNDVRGIIGTQANRLDRAYIERWVDDLGVRDLWASVQ